MLNGKTVAVVVPAYNEEKQIGLVIETMPEFVDRIIVVNDCSTDATEQIVREYIAKDAGDHTNPLIGPRKVKRTFFNRAEILLEEHARKEIAYFVPSVIVNQHPERDRIILINNLKNAGVGGSVARGYKWAKDNNIYCTAVMNGDGQMDPEELESICRPVVEEEVDYVKGNRLIHRGVKYVMPKVRYLGNSILSILTKIASGYWRVSDTQTGYTAISLEALKAINIHDIYPGYGAPNDLLVKLNIASCTLKEIPIKPVYGIGENSKMRVAKVIPSISLLLIKSFFVRLWQKYFIRQFHPLFLLYVLSFLLFLFSIPFGIDIFRNMLIPGVLTPNSTLIVFVFLIISAFQALLFGMWMDMQDNERLYK